VEIVLDAIRKHANSYLPDAPRRRFGAAVEFAEGIVRDGRGDGLGGSLLVMSHDSGGMGGAAVDFSRGREQLAAIDVGTATTHVPRPLSAATRSCSSRKWQAGRGLAARGTTAEQSDVCTAGRGALTQAVAPGIERHGQ
jgi:hypothetical protein